MNLFESIEKLINNQNIVNDVDKGKIESKNPMLSQEELELAEKLK